MTAIRAAALTVAATAIAATSACGSAGSKNAASTAAPSTVSSVSSGDAPATAPTSVPEAATPTATASFTADYKHYVAAAWLTPAELPFTASFSWKSDGTAPVGATGTVQQDWFSCGADWGYDPTKDGVQTISYTAPSGKPQAELAEQLIFFADAQAAGHALDQIAAGYTSCAATTSMPGNGPEGTETVTVKKTASIDAGFAYLHTARKPDGTPGTGVGHWGTDAHEYFVQRGNVLVLITLYAQNTAGGKAMDVTGADSTILQKAADHLTAAYAQG